ncbi:hypothetical protein [Streptomyces stelliscabiei]|uniref:Uncharacterized protein n=1 Tax=Streptomyces stelliscabiei TaxID=146820 RepID=A0A8I0TSQ8_9ACTN|nr:hypothetical protein [Streptomyces stelliscabiei]KND29929.1 hypothetical protein IQ64_41670 [Streptomyces stelliscabiei]MBE1598969.1 hypothetical protein [Streptomyces stelliscabiei]
MDYGDLATWVGVGCAAVAAAATVKTLLSQQQQIKEQREFIGDQRAFMAEQSSTLALERAELRAVAEDRKWAQARQVRMHQKKLGARLNAEGSGLTPNDHWAVTVQNGSDTPVHQLEVIFGTSNLAADVHEWPAFTPDQHRAEAGDRLVAPVFLLGSHRALRFVSQTWQAATLHNNPPTLFFTDGNGIRWSLDSKGKLDEVLPEPQA